MNHAMSLDRKDIINTSLNNNNVNNNQHNEIFFVHTHNNTILDPSPKIRELVATINSLLPEGLIPFNTTRAIRRSPNLRSLLMFSKNICCFQRA